MMGAKTQTICDVPLDTFEQFVRGELDESASGTFSAHALRCDECRSRLDSVRQNLAIAASVSEAMRRRLSIDGKRPLPRRIGRYTIVRELGTGAVGTVYLAEQDHPRRSVALKLLKSEGLLWQTRGRLDYEAAILARLQHPSIAQVFDAGFARTDGEANSDEVPFVAMEYVEGERLDDYARRHSLTRAQRIELLTQLADAIHSAHLKGVIHRDLKPGNIIVDASGRPKIVDFGTALIGDPKVLNLTQSIEPQAIAGTLPYMSPEQIEGDTAAIDARCDVYALGVIGYALIADRLPHRLEDCSLIQAARIASHDDPVPLWRAAPDCPADLAAVIHMAMERSPDRRYASAAQLAWDLRRALAGEPVMARRPSTMEAARRWARRHRPLVAAIFTSAIALAVGAAATFWQMQVARSQRDEAQRRLAQLVDQTGFLMNDVVTSLLQTPGGSAAGSDVAQRVLENLTRLAHEHSENLSVQLNYAGSLRQVAAILNRRGEQERAALLMRQSHNIVCNWFDQRPHERSTRFSLAYSLRYMTSILRDEMTADERREALEQSVQLLDVLAAEHGEDTVYARELAASLHALGRLEWHEGRLQSALITTDRARSEYARMKRLAPDDANAARGEISVQMSLARVNDQLSQHEAAHELLREALETAQARQEAFPGEVPDKDNFGAASLAMAEHFLAQGDSVAAKSYASQALGLYEELAATDPETQRWRTLLSRAREIITSEE